MFNIHKNYSMKEDKHDELSFVMKPYRRNRPNKLLVLGLVVGSLILSFIPSQIIQRLLMLVVSFEVKLLLGDVVFTMPNSFLMHGMTLSTFLRNFFSNLHLRLT